MESLCLLKAMSNFPLSNPSTAILNTSIPFTVDHFLMDPGSKKSRLSVKRRPSFEETDRKLGLLIPSKQRRMTDTADHLQMNCLEAEHSTENQSFDHASANKVYSHFLGSVDCETSQTLVMKPEDLTMQDNKTNSDRLGNGLPSPIHTSSMALFSEASPKSRSESAKTARSVSAPSLGTHEIGHEVTGTSQASNTLHGDGESEIENILKNGREIVEIDNQIARCRSAPSDIMTPDIGKENKLLSLLQEDMQQFPAHIHQQFNTQSLETSIKKTSDRPGQYEISSCDDTSNGNNSDIKMATDDALDNDNCDSSPPTPSSCYVDIEADTPPSSPLNLTTTGCDAPGKSNRHKHSTFINTDSILPSDETFDPTKNTTSCVTQEDKDFDSPNHLKNTPRSSEKLKEKSIKFSIDAILRPDFGVSHSQMELPNRKILERSQVTPASTRSSSIRSSHSAFTAVDLSTRSRSHSLSSRSCSSSSPSPPLLSSSSSPSPRQKADFHHSTVYEKNSPGHENFQFPTRLFSDPCRDLENLFSGSFPFMRQFPGNGLAKFPFLYHSQISPYYKMNVEKELLKQQPIPEILKSKGDPDFQTDLSKLFGHSLCPFMNDPLQSTPESKTKIPQEHPAIVAHSKNVQGLPSHVIRHQKRSSIPHDVTPVTKPTVATHSNDVNPRSSRSKSISQFNIASPTKDGSQANKADTLKPEKPSPPQTKPGEPSAPDKAENPLWPAWVFCTRYSDRPSSGPRSRKPKRNKPQDEKRPRTAFTNDQLQRLKREFEDCRYLTETRRKSLAEELGLTESQIKIWFQNKRAKIKKSVGMRNPLALRLMEQGLYNHSTVKPGEEGYVEEGDDE